MSDIKLGLERIVNVMEKLDNPQNKLNVIHIAGTNGKGSVGAYLESICMESGYNVGRYASPAVFDEMEIIKISGKSITHEEYKQKLDYLKSIDEELTSFELETALAFLYFFEKKCDIVIIEVGLGGRLDATNIVKKPLCEIITSISMDHMQFLGRDLESIANEKCGIIKKDTKVVTFNQESDVQKVIKQKSTKEQAKLIIADFKDVKNKQFLLKSTKFEYKKDKYTINMLGEHQIENALLAIEAALCLEIEQCHIALGIEKTNWRGRLEIISTEPIILIDGAHNEKAAYNLEKAVELYFKNMDIIYIVGVLADKECEKMLSIMAKKTEKIITFSPNNDRALPSDKLTKTAKKYFKNIINAENIQNALEFVFTLDKIFKEKNKIINNIDRKYNVFNKIDKNKYQITDNEKINKMKYCLEKNGFIDKTDREKKDGTVFLVFGSLSFMKDI